MAFRRGRAIRPVSGAAARPKLRRLKANSKDAGLGKPSGHGPLPWGFVDSIKFSAMNMVKRAAIDTHADASPSREIQGFSLFTTTQLPVYSFGNDTLVAISTANLKPL